MHTHTHTHTQITLISVDSYAQLCCFTTVTTNNIVNHVIAKTYQFKAVKNYDMAISQKERDVQRGSQKVKIYHRSLTTNMSVNYALLGRNLCSSGW